MSVKDKHLLCCHRLSYYVTGAVFIFVPLVFIPACIDPSLIVALKWFIFGLFSMLSAALWVGRLQKPDLGKINLPELAVLFFLVANLLSYLFSFSRDFSSEQMVKVLLLWLFSITISRFNIEDIDKYLKGVLVIAVLLSFMGIFLAAGIDPFMLGPESIKGIALTFPNGSILGAFLLFAMAVSVNTALSRENHGERVLYAVFTITILTCIILTKSRSAWMGAATVFIVSILYHLLRSDRFRLKTLVLSVFLIALTSGVFTFITWKSLNGEPSVKENTVVAERLLNVENSLLLIREKPLTGWGPGIFGIASPKYKGQLLRKAQYRKVEVSSGHAYNDPLEVTADLGFTGLLGYILMLGVIVAFGFKSKNRYFFAKIVSGIAGLTVFSFFHFALPMPIPSIFLWFSIGAVIGDSKKSFFSVAEKFNRTGVVLSFVFVLLMIYVMIPPVVATYYFHSGSAAIVRRDFSAASAYFEKVIKIRPSSFQAHVNLGGIYFKDRNYTAALKEFEKALEIAPFEDRIHLNIGLCYANLKKLDQAALSFEASLGYNPSNRITYFLLHDVYSRTGNTEKLKWLNEQVRERNIALKNSEEKQ